jgi:hypothetical protein
MPLIQLLPKLTPVFGLARMPFGLNKDRIKILIIQEAPVKPYKALDWLLGHVLYYFNHFSFAFINCQSQKVNPILTGR